MQVGHIAKLVSEQLMQPLIGSIEKVYEAENVDVLCPCRHTTIEAQVSFPLILDSLVRTALTIRAAQCARLTAFDLDRRVSAHLPSSSLRWHGLRAAWCSLLSFRSRSVALDMTLDQHRPTMRPTNLTSNGVGRLCRRQCQMCSTSYCEDKA
jgi:hypothetical protein